MEAASFALLCLLSLGAGNGAEAVSCEILSLQRASCRGRNLTRAPSNLSAALESLDLSYNKIRSVASGDFSALVRLKDLDLSFNLLRSVAHDAFAGNLQLERLNLFNNSLTEIPAQALRPLGKLKVLSISNNLYPRATLDATFGALKHLEDLSMGGPAITTVAREDFRALEALPLKKFALKTASRLSEYQSGAFSKLNASALWCDISVDHNAEALPLILRDLRGRPLEYLRFRNLFEFTYYTDPVDLFSGLAEVDVKELVFFRGKFNENLLRWVLLGVQRSHHVRDLSFLAIDFAGSPQGQPPGAGVANLTLRRLVLQDISNPDVLRFDGTFTWFAGVAHLSILNVNFNVVPCAAWEEMKTLVALDVSNNRLADGYLYNDACSYQGIVPRLEQLNLSYNALTRLRTVARLTFDWPRLSALDLSHNRIGSGQDRPCAWTPNLVWLALAYNAVTADIFRCLPATLRFLDLSHSQLERLEMDYFEAAVDLRELLLTGNKIKFIPTEWRCPNLRLLAVDGNSFGVIGQGSFLNMPQLTQLKAGNNPYHCVCDLHHFLRDTFRERKLTLLDWPQGWTCYHPEPLLDTPVAAYRPRVTECDVTVVAAIAAATTAAVIVACMVLCWRFDLPWYLKATFQIVRSKYRAARAQGARPFAYHAFISYSFSDAEWVRGELLRRLEASSPPYHVCIHERDFTPGRWIIDNIIDNIEKSRKVIFVLSRSFVDSEWCNYELYFAHQRAVGLGFEDVVLVVKEAIDPQALPHKFYRLRKMLSAKTYLEWPPEPNRQAFFWVQLTSVLGKAETAPTEPKNHPEHRGQTPPGLTNSRLEPDSPSEGNAVTDFF